MPGERNLPGLGLKAFYDRGSDDWDTGYDENIRQLSLLTQLIVLDTVDEEPASPSEGDRYLLSSAATTNAEDIAIYDNAEWVYYTPEEGWSLYDLTLAGTKTFDGTEWLEDGVEEAGVDTITVSDKTASYGIVAADAGSYIRMTVASANTITVPAQADQAIPVGASITVRQSGTGQTTIVAGSGVTLNTSETLLLRKQGSTASLIKVATNIWDVAGDMEAA